jgi:hypothetical protein
MPVNSAQKTSLRPVIGIFFTSYTLNLAISMPFLQEQIGTIPITEQWLTTLL